MTPIKRSKNGKDREINLNPRVGRNPDPSTTAVSSEINVKYKGDANVRGRDMGKGDIQNMGGSDSCLLV